MAEDILKLIGIPFTLSIIPWIFSEVTLFIKVSIGICLFFGSCSVIAWLKIYHLKKELTLKCTNYEQLERNSQTLADIIKDRDLKKKEYIKLYDTIYQVLALVIIDTPPEARAKLIAIVNLFETQYTHLKERVNRG